MLEIEKPERPNIEEQLEFLKGKEHCAIWVKATLLESLCRYVLHLEKEQELRGTNDE